MLDRLCSLCCCLTWKVKGEGMEGPQPLNSNGGSSAKGGWCKGRMTRSEQGKGRKVLATGLLFQEGWKGPGKNRERPRLQKKEEKPTVKPGEWGSSWGSGRGWGPVIQTGPLSESAQLESLAVASSCRIFCPREPWCLELVCAVAVVRKERYIENSWSKLGPIHFTFLSARSFLDYCLNRSSERGCILWYVRC